MQLDHRKQQKRPGRNRTDLPHLLIPSASTSVVKSLKQFRRCERQNIPALISNAE
jgi:hypothetical protein